MRYRCVADCSAIVEREGRMKLMAGWKFSILVPVLATCAALCPPNTSLGQDKSAPEQPAAQDSSPGKTNPAEAAEAKPAARAKPGTKQAVEARLKAVEHAKPADGTEPIHEVEKTLFATRRFEQAAISPDARRVAWVETLIGKDGAPSGNTAIYVFQFESKAAPKRLKAGVGPGDHEEGNVAWSPDCKRVAFLSDALKPGQRQLYVAQVSGAEGSATNAAAKKLTNVKGFLAAPSWSPGWKDHRGVVHGECHASVRPSGGGDSRDGRNKGFIF